MRRVLVAEDEPGIALGLEDTLRLEGYHVEVVTTGPNASRRAREESFDLILLDVMLPGKSGFDVCRELRASGLEAPIIFLTARTQEADRVSGLDLGANDYVTKPFSARVDGSRARPVPVRRFEPPGPQAAGRRNRSGSAGPAAAFPISGPRHSGFGLCGLLPARAGRERGLLRFF